MSGGTKKIAHCAIYTRKSTEHNLDLEFNSLDAQREACEAYIKSQAHEGWRLVPNRYDDGGLSGASLERAALEALLADLQSGRIDIVVVYKVDRLTRSLADFAKLVEIFDRHNVSFVSVTQSFNTTTSMGRLTLNMLLSFAQFEREVIGERVRDKIAASKRKGIWVGGPVPLGYSSVNKKLVVVPEEADAVRTIFRRYLETGSVGALVQDLNQRGIRSKKRALSNGRVVGGGCYGMGALAHLLRNRFYIGEIAYRGEIHAGGHEPILDRSLFDAVQQKLTANTVDRALRLRAPSALLVSRIFDEQGNRMTPTHTRKQSGVRYRYYVSQAVLQRKATPKGMATRVPGEDVERMVMRALRERVEYPLETSVSDNELINRHLNRVIVSRNCIHVKFSNGNPGQMEQNGEIDPDTPNVEESVTLDWLARGPFGRGVLHEPLDGRVVPSSKSAAVLTWIAKARTWLNDLETGRAEFFAEIAQREGKVERYVRRLAAYAFVSPGVVRRLLDDGPFENTVSPSVTPIPDFWPDQIVA